jgi:hypothetical protein
MHNIEFIKYTGDYPNLCRGLLTLKINDKIVEFPKDCMCSGGSCFIKQQKGYVTTGDWTVNVPDEYNDYKKEIEDLVNENVPRGCCGGCL